MVEGLRERETHPRDLRPLCRRERRRHHPAPPGRGRAGRRDAARPPSCSPTSRASPPSPSTSRPTSLVAALNEYLETVLEPIRAHGGVVNTFIGDGLFASFNMPLACEDHACAACARGDRHPARRRQPHLRRPWAWRWPPASASARASVIGGSVGAGQRISFTLLGDTVNLAARLEQLNKDYGTRILVSEQHARGLRRAVCLQRARQRRRARPQRCRLPSSASIPTAKERLHERVRICRPTR